MSRESGFIPMAEAMSQNRNLLGLANKALPNQGDFEYAGDVISKEVSGRSDIVIISWANGNMDGTSAWVGKALKGFGAKSTVAIHQRDPKDFGKIIRDAQGVFMTGGDTFNLAANLYADRHANGNLVDSRPGANPEPVVEDLRALTADGAVIMGTSAGLMVMSDDIRTCVDTRRVVRIGEDGTSIRTDGLDLLGSPINFHPHYGSDGESYKKLAEYVDGDPSRRIIGLPNGTFITVKGDKMEFHGAKSATLLTKGRRQFVKPGRDISHLLKA